MEKRVLLQKIDQFLFAPGSGKVLAFFRIAIALFCILKFFSFYGDLLNIFGSQGYVKGDVAAILLADFMPRVSWFTHTVAAWGIGEVNAIYCLFFLFIGVLILMCCGFQTRLMAILALFIHLMFFNSGRMFMYGVDYFTTSALFYCTIMPVGKYYSIDNFLRHRLQNPSPVSIFCIRVLQIHLCLVYFFGGFSKTLGVHWWNGEAIWRAISIPGFYQLDMSWLATVPWLSLVLSRMVMLVELSYPVLIWFRKTRLIVLLLVGSMHLGIGIAMGLHYFAALMILLNITAFGWPYIEKRYAGLRNRDVVLHTTQ